MAQIRLEVLDPPDIDQVQAGPDFKRWLSNVVDILNASLEDIQNAANFLITASGIDVGGGGAGPINVPVIGLTPTGVVNVTLISTTNPNISIASVVPQTNSFDITFTANPGASAIIVYQAFIEQP